MCSLMQRPQRLLDQHTQSTNAYNSPKPLVAQLLRLRPERILLLSELLELLKLGWMRLGIAASLTSLFLPVAAEEAQKAVVC